MSLGIYIVIHCVYVFNTYMLALVYIFIFSMILRFVVFVPDEICQVQFDPSASKVQTIDSTAIGETELVLNSNSSKLIQKEHEN